MNKFQVYAQTRATRQLAGDIVNSMQWDDPERVKWEKIERELNDIECKLEGMNLK